MSQRSRLKAGLLATFLPFLETVSNTQVTESLCWGVPTVPTRASTDKNVDGFTGFSQTLAGGLKSPLTFCHFDLFNQVCF